MATRNAKVVRFTALDSLRGLAAISVYIRHLSILTPFSFIYSSPLKYLANGHAAVILFFVLSGFALTLQIQATGYSYGSYLIKRIIRIYVPYITAVSLAFLLASHLAPGQSTRGLGPWYNSIWTNGGDVGAFLQHAILIDSFNSLTFNPVVWSLVYEMRISLIFPAIPWLFNRFGLLPVVAVAALGSLFSFAYILAGHRSLNQDISDTSWIPTLHYICIFACGAGVALYRDNIASAMDAPNKKLAVLTVGIIVYMLSLAIELRVPGSAGDFLTDGITTVGTLCIISALVAGAARSFFESRILVYMGRISYSFYLYHLTVIIAVFHILPNNAGLALAITTILSLCTAALGERFIERPSITWGRTLAARFAPAPKECKLTT